jgi:hypothetical protein
MSRGGVILGDTVGSVTERETSADPKIRYHLLSTDGGMSDIDPTPPLTTCRKCSSSGPNPSVALVRFSATGTV